MSQMSVPHIVPSDNVDRRLSLYSVAAMAAGVSFLALVQPADAEVVVTKKTISVTTSAPVSIDLNNDGVADLKFSILVGGYGHSFLESLIVSPITAGQAVGTSAGTLGFGPYASALVAGKKIGPSAHFVGRKRIISYWNNSPAFSRPRFTPKTEGNGITSVRTDTWV